MRKVIPFEPQQMAYFLRWLRDMSRKGWELKDVRGFDAIFAPASSEKQEYALFPPEATAQELDELFRRIEEGSITVPSKPERPMPNRLTLPEDPRLTALMGKIGAYSYIQLVCQLRRENGWEAISDWAALPLCAAPGPMLCRLRSFRSTPKKQSRIGRACVPTLPQILDSCCLYRCWRC